MNRHLRRTRIETVAALSAGLLCLLTLVVPDWIEVVFRVDPDGGDGIAEWAVAGRLALVAVVLGLAARRDHRAALTHHAEPSHATPQPGRTSW